MRGEKDWTAPGCQVFCLQESSSKSRYGVGIDAGV